MTLDSRTRWYALVVLCLGTLMIVLDTTIVNVALPSIRDDLGFSSTSLAWVVNAYLLTFGGFLLLGGRLGDLYGHRRLFLAGIGLFTAASLACGLSTSQESLIVARAVQGVGGAIASAVSLSLTMMLFTEPADRAKAMGIFGFVASGGGSIGVLLGGVLTDVLDWHWIFLVNIPIGIAVVLLSLRLLPGRSGEAGTGRLDVAGAVTVTAALMLAVYAIVNGNQNGWTRRRRSGCWPPPSRCSPLFLAIEARISSPLDPARPLPLAQRRDGQRRRRALGRLHVRVVLPLGALPPARAGLHAAQGRPGVPAGQRHHGHPVRGSLGQARHALWHQAPARDRPVRRRGRAAAGSRGLPSTAPTSSTCSRAWCCWASARASPSIPSCWRP